MSDRFRRALRAYHRQNMRLGTCLLLACACGVAGLGMRLLLPVTPVDASFRDVIRLYQPQAGMGDSNMRETSAP